MTSREKDLAAWMMVAAALVLGLFVAFPSFLRSLHPSRSSEATMNVRKLYDGSVTYFADHAAFPRSSPITPALEHQAGACMRDRRMETSEWDNNEVWAALQFEVRDPHRFVYQYDSNGVGNTAQFTASAFGDLDCDGIHSTFVRFGKVVDMEVQGSSGVYIANELE